MNGTSGFGEVRSSISRSSTNRLLREQRHRFRTGFWHLIRTHDRIVSGSSISVNPERVVDTFIKSFLRSFTALFLAFLSFFAFIIEPPTVDGAEVPPIAVCLSDLVEYLTSRDTHTPPLPDPPPLLLGCRFPGCGLGTSDSTRLEIKLSGDLVDSVAMAIEGASPKTLNALKTEGQALQASDHMGRFHIRKGNSSVGSFPLEMVALPRNPEKLVDAVLNSLPPQTEFVLPPTSNFHLVFDQVAVKNLADKVRADERRSSEPSTEKLASTELTIRHMRGDMLIALYNFRYAIKSCEGPVSDKPDRVHLLDTMGSDFANEAVVLANGLVGQAWVKPDAFRSTTLFNMPDNRRTPDPPTQCHVKGNTCCTQVGAGGNNESCASEVSVFSQDMVMKLVTPVIDWTDNLGDEVPVTIAAGAVEVPVQFYVVWEHTTAPILQRNPDPPSPCPTSPPTTACMAELWLTAANAFFWGQNSGIEFKMEEPITVNISSPFRDASCKDLDAIHRHFKIDLNSPQAVRVYFVRFSTDVVNIGNTTNMIPTSGWTCGDQAPYYNDIFVSTALANPTTLAHEFGHSLSLDDINDISQVPSVLKPYADGLAEDNLMWSGSDMRVKMTKAQSFRANVNRLSAPHRHAVPGRVLDTSPRDCLDGMDNYTCPKLILDK